MQKLSINESFLYELGRHTVTLRSEVSTAIMFHLEWFPAHETWLRRGRDIKLVN